ncbi:MAG: Asp-tRNA(Asn)/Glu-tRNA(Gln) amidotransferase subunit GatC [Gammaproteobacteria bacterium]|nr:Asp-tRNA(Asn)/Glu-tRNA(Gln) amidotransferase subunit GatC [Gammaproteobacteria bacterium]
MTLEHTDVERIAHLARLQISGDEIPAYQNSLSAILALVGELKLADVGQVLPMAHPLDVAQRLRPDVVSEADQRDRFLAIAPHSEAGLYLVPKVIE